MSVELSIVVAVYNEHSKNLLALLERLWKVLSPTGISYEVVFVNDGSRAETSRALRQIAGEVEYVKLVELSRNFGQQAAIQAGMDHADGDAVVNIDSDLQDPPELIPRMVDLWKDGYDVVYAQRSTRRDGAAKRLSAFMFYRLLGALSSTSIPRDTGDFRLIDRKVVEALASLPEKVRFLRGMVPWLGFKQTGIPIDRDAREVGESGYTFRKLMALSLDGLLAFSTMPLFLMPLLGAAIIGLGLVGYIALAFAGMTGASDLEMFWLAATFVVFTGLQIACTGLIAVYLSRVLEEVRARPTYVVSERIGLPFARSEDEPGDRVNEDVSVDTEKPVG